VPALRNNTEYYRVPLGFMVETALSQAAACLVAETQPPIPRYPLRISSRRQFPSLAKVRSLRLRYTQNNIVLFFPEVQIIRYDAHKSRTAKQVALHCPSVHITLTFPPPPSVARATDGNSNAKETYFKRP
jgi:hypothetical protein